MECATAINQSTVFPENGCRSSRSAMITLRMPVVPTGGGRGVGFWAVASGNCRRNLWSTRKYNVVPLDICGGLEEGLLACDSETWRRDRGVFMYFEMKDERGLVPADLVWSQRFQVDSYIGLRCWRLIQSKPRVLRWLTHCQEGKVGSFLTLLLGLGKSAPPTLLISKIPATHICTNHCMPKVPNHSWDSDHRK